jgi:hypothetical protein
MQRNLGRSFRIDYDPCIGPSRRTGKYYNSI